MLSWSRCDRNRGTTRRPWQPSVPPFGRATSRGEGSTLASPRRGMREPAAAHRDMSAGGPGDQPGGCDEAVLLSLEFELDVIDGTPEPVLTRLVRLHDRMSSLAGVSPGVTVGRIVAAADVRARGAPPQVDPGPTVAQAVDASRPARVLRRDRIQVRADVGHRYAYPTSRPRLPPGKAWSPTPAWLRGHTMSKVRPLDRPVCRPARSRGPGSRPSIRAHGPRASTRWPTSAAAREPVPP